MSDDTTTTKKKELRPLEVSVGAGAAVITAFASSYLGTAGTLSGAALASVVGTVSTSVLRTSADRSRERLRQTTARIRETRSGAMPTPTDIRPVETGSADIDPYGTQLLPLGHAGIRNERPGRQRGPVRPRWVVLGAGAVMAFAFALVAITGIESAAGKPLAGLVGKQTGGGTTIGHATGSDPGSSSTPAPSPDSSPTPASGSSATGSPTGGPDGATSATEPTPAPSATSPAPTPSATQPAPNPLTTQTP